MFLFDIILVIISKNNKDNAFFNFEWLKILLLNFEYFSINQIYNIWVSHILLLIILLFNFNKILYININVYI